MNSLDKNKIEIKSFVYDWGLIFLVMLLVFIISIPPIIWNEENLKISDSRKRMLDLAYALKAYNKLTGQLTDDKELIFETIMHVRDSLIANETLNGNKNIYLSCEYEATFLMDPIEGSRGDQSPRLNSEKTQKYRDTCIRITRYQFF